MTDNTTLEALKLAHVMALKNVVDFETQIAELEKPVKWEPKGGPYFITCKGNVVQGRSTRARKFGIERETEEQAGKSAVEMRKFNRLLAYRDEFAPGYIFKKGGCNAYVYFDHDNKNWDYSFAKIHENASVVYMPDNIAKELVTKLRSGEVEI